MDLIDEKIKEMFTAGKTDAEIAVAVGRKTTTIGVRRRVLGLRRHPGIKPNIELKNKIIELRKTGKCYNEIATELGVSKNTVARYCFRAGIGGERLPRKKYLKVHKNNPHMSRSSFIISCGSWYLEQLDISKDKELIAKVTPEKPNKLIMEIFEKDKVI